MMLFKDKWETIWRMFIAHWYSQLRYPFSQIMFCDLPIQSFKTELSKEERKNSRHGWWEEGVGLWKEICFAFPPHADLLRRKTPWVWLKGLSTCWKETHSISISSNGVDPISPVYDTDCVWHCVWLTFEENTYFLKKIGVFFSISPLPTPNNAGSACLICVTWFF